MTARIGATAFLTGVVAAVGLCLSGMTLPQRIIGFLDFTGAWDPTLLFVMGSAVPVYFVAVRLAQRRKRPVFAPELMLPPRRGIDGRLLAGSAVFGLGWGLGGFCPGPALVSIGTGIAAVGLFVVGMLGGLALVDLLAAPRGRANAEAAPPATPAAS